MRTTRLPGLAALLLALALTACGKDAAEPPSQGGAQMSARIDGQAWASTVAFATRGQQPGSAVAVSGTDIASRTIAFAFIDAGTGTYEIEPGTPANALLVDGSAQWQAGGSSQGSGTITVTRLDAERIAGSFVFTAEPITGDAAGTRVVTQGTFDVEF